MRYLADNPIPELKKVFDDNPVSKFKNLGDVLSGFLNIAFYAAFFLAFCYLVWAAFSYITAQGKKEELQKATARITWAIIGLIVVFLAFFVAKFVKDILGPKGWVPF